MVGIEKNFRIDDKNTEVLTEYLLIVVAHKHYAKLSPAMRALEWAAF